MLWYYLKATDNVMMKFKKDDLWFYSCLLWLYILYGRNVYLLTLI